MTKIDWFQVNTKLFCHVLPFVDPTSPNLSADDGFTAEFADFVVHPISS